MRKFIITHTRPDPSVPFCQVPSSLRVDMDPYLASGALVYHSQMLTPTQQVFVNAWRSPEDSAVFTNHSKSGPRHAFIAEYNASVGIVKTVEIVDE